jgi:hypothetical protein
MCELWMAYYQAYFAAFPVWYTSIAHVWLWYFINVFARRDRSTERSWSSIATWLRAGRSGVRILVGQDISLFSRKYIGRLWGPTQLPNHCLTRFFDHSTLCNAVVRIIGTSLPLHACVDRENFTLADTEAIQWRMMPVLPFAFVTLRSHQDVLYSFQFWWKGSLLTALAFRLLCDDSVFRPSHSVMPSHSFWIECMFYSPWPLNTWRLMIDSPWF